MVGALSSPQSRYSRDGAQAEFRILSMIFHGTLETFSRTGFLRFQKRYTTFFSSVRYVPVHPVSGAFATMPVS